MKRVSQAARILRAFFISLLILSIVAVAFYPKTTTILLQKNIEETKEHLTLKGNPFIDNFYRHQISGSFEANDLSKFDIYLVSSLGHYRVDEDGKFSLPVFPKDNVQIFIDRINNKSAGLLVKNVVVNRQIMPGGWVLIVFLFLIVYYLHLLSKENLSLVKFRNYLTLLIAVLSSILLGSVIIQLVVPYVFHRQTWHLFKPNMVEKFYIYPDITPGIPGGIVSFETNSEGIRARERDLSRWESTQSILALGASTTECLYLGQWNDWPALLETKLRRTGLDVWVGNAGKSGYSTAKIAGVAKDYIPRLKPKYIVLLTGFNEGITPDQHINSLKTQIEISKTKQVIDKLFNIIQRPAIVWLIQTSLFNRQVPSPHDIIFTGSNKCYIEPRERLKNFATLNPPWDRNWQDLDLTDFEKNINEILVLAKKTNAKLILCTQPSMYREDLSQQEKDLLWLMGNYTVRSKRERMDVINNRIKALGKELSLPVVDLDNSLPRTTEVFYDDCHFNRKGARLVADELFKYFVKEFNSKNN